VVTDFCSFYSLPSSILKNPKHKTLRAAYSYYNVAKTYSITELTNDALILAKNEGFDVFNALNILNNSDVFKVLTNFTK
jgi:glycylpeptide N-tetradecanoyltransferase